MSILIKRPFDEDLYDRRFKRCRVMEDLDNSINALQQCPSSAAAEEVLAAAAAASNATSSGERRRSSDCMDDAVSPSQRMEKRMRIDSSPLTEPPNAQLGSSDSWAETLVKTLQGCPSVEEAIQRASRVIGDMAAEVRQVTLSEVEPTSEAPPEDVQELSRVKDMNRILMRGVRQLAERCKRLEGQSEESTMLRQALEQSQDAHRRLQHSHDVLQHHLRLAIGECSGSALPWGSAVH